jgi:hypothetical protein
VRRNGIGIIVGGRRRNRGSWKRILDGGTCRGDEEEKGTWWRRMG